MSDTTFVNGTLIVPDWLNDVNNLRYGAGNATRGSALLQFMPGVTGAVTRTVQDKQREFVSVKDFGAVGDGVTDDTAALQAARDYLASLSNPPALIFPSGTYKYTISPNWAISNAVILAEGRVVLYYQGTGNAVIMDSGASGYTWNMTFGNEENQFFVQGAASSQNGIYTRSVHHSKFGFNVRGCGTAYAALRSDFAVCSSYYISVSGNEGSFGSATPAYGLYLSNRGTYEKVSACIFHNPIMEGVSNTGLYLNSADKNIFIGGTSEGNLGTGVYVSDLSLYNTFIGMDMEENTTRDFDDNGFGTIWTNVISDTTCRTAGRNTELHGGTFNNIVDNGNGTSFNHIEYSSNGGTITGSGTNRSKRSVYNITTATYDHDLAVGSKESVTSCPTATATTVLSLPTTGNNVYFVMAYLPLAGAASTYGAEAIVYQDGATAKLMQVSNGTSLSITLSGTNVQVTQTSGATQNVTAFANKL